MRGGDVVKLNLLKVVARLCAFALALKFGVDFDFADGV